MAPSTDLKSPQSCESKGRGSNVSVEGISAIFSNTGGTEMKEDSNTLHLSKENGSTIDVEVVCEEKRNLAPMIVSENEAEGSREYAEELQTAKLHFSLTTAKGSDQLISSRSVPCVSVPVILALPKKEKVAPVLNGSAISGAAERATLDAGRGQRANLLTKVAASLSGVAQKCQRLIRRTSATGRTYQGRHHVSAAKDGSEYPVPVIGFDELQFLEEDTPSGSANTGRPACLPPLPVERVLKSGTVRSLIAKLSCTESGQSESAH